MSINIGSKNEDVRITGDKLTVDCQKVELNGELLIPDASGKAISAAGEIAKLQETIQDLLDRVEALENDIH